MSKQTKQTDKDKPKETTIADLLKKIEEIDNKLLMMQKRQNIVEEDVCIISELATETYLGIDETPKDTPTDNTSETTSLAESCAFCDHANPAPTDEENGICKNHISPFYCRQVSITKTCKFFKEETPYSRWLDNRETYYLPQHKKKEKHEYRVMTVSFTAGKNKTAIRRNSILLKVE